MLLGYWIYRDHWDKRGAKWFVAMLAIGGAYALCASAQLLVPWLEVKTVLSTVGGFFGLLSYVAFAVFAGKYTETEYHRRPVVKLALVTVPVSYFVFVLVRPIVDLWVTDYWIETEPFRYLAHKPGPGLLFVAVLSYLVGFYNLYRLSIYLLSTSKRATKQLGLLMAGTFSVMLIATASNLGLFPAEHFYHGVYATIPFILFTSLALFRYDFLRVQPVARTAVVEGLDDPVIVLDGDRAVADFNQASTRLWPLLPDAVGEPIADACPDLVDAMWLDDETWDLAVKGDRDELADQITFTVDGTERHFSVNLSTVGGDDESANWVSILLGDVTELERSRWRLEKQNERLDQVASTISHDLRNPINVADGYAELVESLIDEDGLDAGDAETAIEHLHRIRTSHDRMEAIIADILTIAREGKTVDETRQVSLVAAARDAWHNVETEDTTLTIAADRRLQADRSKLLSILENLFRNALDHGPNDVHVTVEATSDGFAVADDGPGIPAEHRDSLFEYGYTTSEEGTGLGLSIVQAMAESHGWTVEHDDGYADGARFVFGNVDAVPLSDSEAASHGDSDPVQHG
ncbi:hypothetical protein I7X12_12280 [Halosimplex litoreum]|uniref:histidine kinase n=1 Tax=Halosimplex litoreum TaxID=1198301 RepID=A0A7T3FVK5_9EURY|nr:ATP-binding protein [Halosimplex litoreum]QPV61540.1 hypothetical protein I7X12_12280 [Halosimplex litoreum]